MAGIRTRLQPLIAEWLLDLRVLGRSPRTLRWYSQKMRWYLAEGGGVQTLEEFTAFELKRYLASLQDRGLAENSVKHARIASGGVDPENGARWDPSATSTTRRSSA